MAKYKPKKDTIEVDAEQFDSSKPLAQWPDQVQENVLSVTGYSYKDMSTTTDPDTGAEGSNGFELEDLDYLITEKDGVVHRMSEANFINEYDLA